MPVSLILVVLGAVLAVAGIVMLVICMRRAARLRRDDVPDAHVQGEMRFLIVLNMAGVGLAFIGLAVVLVGVIL